MIDDQELLRNIITRTSSEEQIYIYTYIYYCLLISIKITFLNDCAGDDAGRVPQGPHHTGAVD